MDVTLVVVGGDAKPSEIKLKLPAILGRGREATLTLPHSLISRQHCEIKESDGQLLVRDLGSLNGTFVGSQRVNEAVLPAGELLTIGTITFRAIYGDAVVDGWPMADTEDAVASSDTPAIETIAAEALIEAEDNTDLEDGDEVVAVEESEFAEVEEAEEVNELEFDSDEVIDFAEISDSSTMIESQQLVAEESEDAGELDAFLRNVEEN